MSVIKTMDCKACRNEIEHAPAHLETSAVATAALAHLKICARCREFRAERRALSELVSSLEAVTAPHDFERRLRARLNADKHKHQARPRLGFAPNAQAIALAASFALLIGVAVIFKQRSNEAFTAGQTLQTAAVNAPGVVATSKDETPRLQQAAGTFNSDADKIGTTNALTRARVREVRRVRVAREVNVAPASSLPAVAAIHGSTVRSNDFSSSAAPVVTLLSVPVHAPSQHLKLLIDEGRGTTRTVRLQNITFGAQSIFERQAGGAAAVAVERSLDTNADGIW